MLLIGTRLSPTASPRKRLPRKKRPLKRKRLANPNAKGPSNLN
jgi:hypothetical protein